MEVPGDHACSDGTVPPHDDSGWWYEPFQDERGAWRCGAKKGHNHLPCLKFGLKDDPNHRCRTHRGRPQVHGMRSKAGPKGKLLARIEAAKKDPQLRNIDSRLAILSAALDLAVEDLEDREPCAECGALPAHSLSTVEQLGRIVGSFSSAVARQEQVANGLKVKLIREGRAELAARFGNILRKHEGKKLTKGLVGEIVGELRGGAS